MRSDTVVVERNRVLADDHYIRLARRTMAEHQLLGVTWELTYRCNTSCLHCYLIKPDNAAFVAAREELETQKCLSVLDEIAELGALNLAFTGGEPLLRRDLFQLIRHARELRFAVHLKTNGTLVTPEVADQIADLYVATVDVSLYGATATVHDSITRVPGSFGRVVQACQLLASRGVSTIARTSLMQANIGQLEKIRSLAHDMGVGFQSDPVITLMDDGCDSPLKLGACDEALCEYWISLDLPESRKDAGERYSGPLCSAGLNQLCVGPYGDVYPCVQFRDTVGSVRHERLVDIWQESVRLKQLQELTWADLTTCYECDLRIFCSPCIGLAWVEHGTMFRPSSIMCRQADIRRQASEKRRSL